MDQFKVQSLIAQKQVVKATDINIDESYLQVGVFQKGNRPSGGGNANTYAPYAISIGDLKTIVNGDGDCVVLPFKPGSVGPKVSFSKAAGSDPAVFKDVIIPGKLEITRGNNGGIYNIAVESSYNNSSPRDTSWNTQYVNAANTSWASLWDISNRSYETWYNAIQTPEGSTAPPQYVSMPSVMRFQDPDTGEYRYWLIMFTAWGVGQYDEQGMFAYDRYEIYPAVTFTKNDYDDAGIDIISAGVHIARKSNGGQIYNAVNEPYAEVGVSPRNTRWNSVYTDSRTGYSGFSDLSNLESRVYTDFTLALNYAVGNNVLDTELIMHDLTTDLYYKVTFQSWTSGGNGGGFTYTRTVIPQSCSIKFADGTVMNTAPSSGTGTTCCYLDSETNKVIGDSSNDTVNVGPGGTHDIPNFSGMLLVNDHNDGAVEMWLAGGGNTTVLINSTPYGPGPGSLTINGGINGYTWTNINNQAGPFTFTVIKTRNSA